MRLQKEAKSAQGFAMPALHLNGQDGLPSLEEIVNLSRTSLFLSLPKMDLRFTAHPRLSEARSDISRQQCSYQTPKFDSHREVGLNPHLLAWIGSAGSVA